MSHGQSKLSEVVKWGFPSLVDIGFFRPRRLSMKVRHETLKLIVRMQLYRMSMIGMSRLHSDSSSSNPNPNPQTSASQWIWSHVEGSFSQYGCTNNATGAVAGSSPLDAWLLCFDLLKWLVVVKARQLLWLNHPVLIERHRSYFAEHRDENTSNKTVNDQARNGHYA